MSDLRRLLNVRHVDGWWRVAAAIVTEREAERAMGEPHVEVRAEIYEMIDAVAARMDLA